MASSAPDVGPGSEAQRKWVALVSVSVPVLLGNDDERAREIAVGTDVLLDLNDPPLPSYLQLLHPRVAPDLRRNDEPLYPYILAADRSGCILLQVVKGNRPDFILCDTDSRAVTFLPPVPSGLNIRRNISIGLIADPHHHGHYVVAQLHPTTSEDHPNRIRIGLVCYSTAEGRWFTRLLTRARQQVRMRNPFSETGVLAQDGRLWWLALAYGVYFCDPCTPQFEFPQLRFLPLRDDCEIEGDVGFDPRIRTLIHQRRCVRPSEGKLRFIEIRGLSYDELDVVPAPNPTVRMWTLDDPEGPDPWTFEYEVAFAEIWESKTYTGAGLMPDEVPHVALIDHYVVYFFQDSKLFGLDMREKNVVAYKECLIDRDQLRFPSSRPIVDAWEVSPRPATLPGDDDSSQDDNVLGSKLDVQELPPPPPTLSGENDSTPDDNLLHTMEGLVCRRQAFCSICCSAVCLSCCPDHKSSHHGDAPGAIVRIHITKDGAAVDAKEIKVHGMGYNWQLIQCKMDAGRKFIILRDPPEDRRNKSNCFQCNKRVKSKSQFCSPACKALQRPIGQSTHIIDALVQADFNLAAHIDRFCQTCMRGFASVHCSNHEVHHHGYAAAAPPPPAQEPPADL